MKKLNLRSLIFFLILLFFSSSGYSQTEYDYYEKQRLERKEKKVKTISHFYGNDKNLMNIEHFDREGMLKKSEQFGGNDIPPCKYSEINILNNNNKSDLTGTITYYNCGVKSHTIDFAAQNPSYFYNIGMGENLTEEIIFKFDSGDRLIEQIWVCSDCGYTPERSEEEALKETYDTVKFVYDNSNILIKKVYETGDETRFIYNEQNLMIREEFYSQNENTEHFVVNYIYEFY